LCFEGGKKKKGKKKKLKTAPSAQILSIKRGADYWHFRKGGGGKVGLGPYNEGRKGGKKEKKGKSPISLWKSSPKKKGKKKKRDNANTWERCRTGEGFWAFL